MAGRKKAAAHSSNASQTSITNWLSSTPRAKPAGKQSGDTAQAVQGAPKRLAAVGPHSNTPRLKSTVSFGSSNLSSPPPEDMSSPLRRSTRIRASATPAPAPTPKKPVRKFVRQTPPRMPQGIKGPSPLRDKPRRASPSYYWTAEGYRDPSDTDEVPSSQKDDAEYIDDDIETLESIPIFHMSSLPSSPSSDGGAPTPATSTPPPPLSPESKTRNIIAEIRAKALMAASRSPPTKRSLSPSDDSDSDALPDPDFFFGNKAHPNKRRASTTPSPTKVRRSARKSKMSPVVLLPTPKATKPKPAPIPFAALIRERDARAKREESLPRAPDGSRQDIFAIANAALLRDPDATFEDVGAEGGSQDATAALDQLAEGGFAAEAEMVRRAGTTPEVLGWTMFTPGEEVKGEMLPQFPKEIGALLKTKKATRTWEWISERMNAQDYTRVAGILDSNLVDLAFSDPQEHGAVESLIRWLVELGKYLDVLPFPRSNLVLNITVSPPALAFARGASHQASLLLRHLDSEAQDRIALHIARCVLRVGIPGDGVLLARSILSQSSDSDETSFAVPSVEQRHDRILACMGMLGAKDVFPVLSVLCILGVDPTLEVSIRCHVAEVAEMWACKSESIEAQLDVCSRLAHALADLPIQQKRDVVLRILRGTRPIGVQLTMWLATALLDGKGLKGVTPQTYHARPPLERILEYTLKFHITYETNYSDLLATAQLLDIALWDVASLVDTERSEGKIVKYQPGVPVNSMVTDVINKLAEVHGRILDARAADLERTRTKAYLQTLQVRLGWDLIEAARSGQKTAKTIKEMWGRPRPAVA